MHMFLKLLFSFVCLLTTGAVSMVIMAYAIRLLKRLVGEKRVIVVVGNAGRIGIDDRYNTTVPADAKVIESRLDGADAKIVYEVYRFNWSNYDPKTEG